MPNVPASEMSAVDLARILQRINRAVDATALASLQLHVVTAYPREEATTRLIAIIAAKSIRILLDETPKTN